MAKTVCRICHAVDVPLDKNRRCHGCATAKAADNSGMHYGNFVAWRKERREMLKKKNPAAYQKIIMAEAGEIELPQCKVCGEYIWDGRRKDTCSRECDSRREKAKQEAVDSQGGETWNMDEPIFE